MTKQFQRTFSGKRAKYHFYAQVLVWVEGPTDTAVLQRIVHDLPCRLEPANGKPECLRLAREIAREDRPFVVVIDGDYDLLYRWRSSHRRVVRLHRYSIENYLFEQELIETVCREYVMMFGSKKAALDDEKDIANAHYIQALQGVTKGLRGAIVRDIAAVFIGHAPRVLPNRIESLLHGKGLSINVHKVEGLCRQFDVDEFRDQIDDASRRVTEFERRARLIDLLRGHLVFGLIRRIIFLAIEKVIARRPNIDDKALMLLLASHVWEVTRESKHHTSLKRRLRQSVREAAELRRKKNADPE